jgi:hypothetical protein
MRARGLAEATRSMSPSLDQLEFHPGSHTYLWLGQELPSVTKIMRRHQLGFQGFAPQSALDRGNYVHEAFPLVAEDALDWPSVPEEYVGYCRAAEAYLRDTGTRVVRSEVRLVEPELGYCGTLDFIGIRRGRRLIGEVKTGDASDWDVQAAAYERMWRRWFPQLAVHFGEGVKLNEDGTWRSDELNLSEGLNVFMACLVLERRRAR